MDLEVIRKNENILTLETQPKILRAWQNNDQANKAICRFYENKN